jgi:hypothetical protein
MGGAIDRALTEIRQEIVGPFFPRAHALRNPQASNIGAVYKLQTDFLAAKEPKLL